MTAAYRLKGGGWLFAAVAIALGFYLVSLRVAEERKRLEAVNTHIIAAQRDIRALETEFETRANLVQLERWNGDTLALAAPTAGQFVRDEGELAAIAAGVPSVRTAALVVPAIAAPAAVPATLPPGQPVALAAAAAGRPAAIHLPATPLDPAARGEVRVAATATAAATTVPVHAHTPAALVSARALARLANAERASQAVAKVRPQAVAMLDDKLLSDATLGDLLATAKREARRR